MKRTRDVPGKSIANLGGHGMIYSLGHDYTYALLMVLLLSINFY